MRATIKAKLAGAFAFLLLHLRFTPLVVDKVDLVFLLAHQGRI